MLAVERGMALWSRFRRKGNGEDLRKIVQDEVRDALTIQQYNFDKGVDGFLSALHERDEAMRDRDDEVRRELLAAIRERRR